MRSRSCAANLALSRRRSSAADKSRNDSSMLIAVSGFTCIAVDRSKRFSRIDNTLDNNRAFMRQTKKVHKYLAFHNFQQPNRITSNKSHERREIFRIRKSVGLHERPGMNEVYTDNIALPQKRVRCWVLHRVRGRNEQLSTGWHETRR